MQTWGPAECLLRRIGGGSGLTLAGPPQLDGILLKDLPSRLRVGAAEHQRVRCEGDYQQNEKGSEHRSNPEISRRAISRLTVEMASGRGKNGHELVALSRVLRPVFCGRNRPPARRRGKRSWRLGFWSFSLEQHPFIWNLTWHRHSGAAKRSPEPMNSAGRGRAPYGRAPSCTVGGYRSRAPLRGPGMTGR